MSRGAQPSTSRFENPIPPAVRRNAERAEELARQARGDQPQEQPQEGAQEGQQDPPEGQQAPEPQTQEARPEPPQSPQPPPVQQDDPNSDTWQHKFVSEQGRTQKLRQDVSALSQEVSNLRELLATMQTAQHAPPPSELKEDRQQQQFKANLTPEEIEQWGPDLISVIDRKAREIAYQIANEETQGLRDQVKQLGGRVDTVGQTAAVTAQEQMKRALDRNEKIGGWREINHEDEFLGWLQYPDPLSGKKRHDMLLSAWNSNDASRVAAFFESFLKETGRAPAPSSPATQGNGAAPQPAKPTLEAFAAPGKSRSSAPSNGAQPSKPTITTGDISRFFADKLAGRFKGREADAETYEREIFAAQNEGRIKPGPASRN